MSQVTEINRPEQLDEIRLHWRALLARTREGSFFQSLDWLESYWRHYGRDQKLRVLVVRSCGKMIGILPLVVRNEETRLGRIRVLTYPLHDWGTFYGPIGSDATATLLAGLAHVRRTERDWDLLELRWVDGNRVDYGRTGRALQAAGLAARKQPWNRSAFVDLADGWDAYWADRKSHWRTNVRRSERKLAKEGRVTFERYRPDGANRGDIDPRWDLYDACVGIAQKSWQGSSETGTTMSHGSVDRYLRDAHVAAVRAGALDLNLLRLDGQPIAFAYNYHRQGALYGLRMGFDANLSRSGAGSVLIRRMVEDSCRRKDLAIDMGPGSIECKRHWSTSLATSYRYTHYAPTAVRMQALRLKRWVQGRLDRDWLPGDATKSA